MKIRKFDRKDESGAALMMVLVVTLLLGTACIAILSGVGASSRNNTDALSEAKAYWAAESGLQRTIDLLRHQKIAYSAAHNDPDLSTWLGTGRIPVGSEAAFTMEVRDPDNTASATTFSVTGQFEQPDKTWAPSRVFTDGTNTTTISYEGVSNVHVTHPMDAPVSFGRFKVESTEVAAPISEVKFKLIFSLSTPASGARTIRGTISSAGAITFLPTVYELKGSTITICGGGSCPTALPAAAISPGALSTPVNGIMTPLEPFRLLVKATGYGPNSSQKVLEGVIQKNFLNGLGSDNAITLLGRGDCTDTVQFGTSKNMDIDGGTSPSIGVPSTQVLGEVTTDMVGLNGTVSPAPEVYLAEELPDWQQSPAALDSVIRKLRQSAQNSGRYFASNNVSGGWGDHATGTGLTFCEGDCSMIGNISGGGILVVTGTFTTGGSPAFKGLVLVAGVGRMIRGGNGQDTFYGTTILAPYDPNNLAAGWGCPRYEQNGGAGDHVNVGLEPTLDGTEAISNFMIGVAEK